jgi:hypothetical protein
MTIDIERAITDTLRTRADRDVDTNALLAGATGRARVLGTRRKLIVAGAVVAALAATGAAVATVPAFLGAPRLASPTGTSTADPNAGVTPPPPGGYRVPSLPVADGVAGAAARPDLVGTDPGVLHFDLAAEASGAYQVSWTVGEGHESVDIDGTKSRLRLDLGPDRGKLDNLDRVGGFSDIWPSGVTTGGGDPRKQPTQHVTVGGRPVTLDETRYYDGVSVWVLRWQPVDGLWARVEAAHVSRDGALAFADKVRPALDRSRRCVVPTHVTTLPSGLRWTGCGVQFSGYDRTMWSSIVTFADASGEAISVRTDGGPPPPGPAPSANRTVGGHPATWSGRLLTITYPDFGDVQVELAPGTPPSEQAATRLGEVVEMRGRPGEPDSWPAHAVG